MLKCMIQSIYVGAPMHGMSLEVYTSDYYSISIWWVWTGGWGTPVETKCMFHGLSSHDLVMALFCVICIYLRL